MSPSGHFQHSRLSLSGRFMRLLQIQGSTTGSASSNASSSVNGKREAPISLRITQYALHRRPPYVAISYTWGNAAHSHEIRVNGRPFLVRANLYSLLWHLRQCGESRFLWIDALCIDQANLEERNFHVQLMGSIYESADRTIVWLGLPSEDRRQARALEFVAELASAMSPTSTSHSGQGRPKAHAANQDSWERLYITGRGSVNVASANVNTTSTSTTAKLEARWRNLLDLCCGVYWTRTWIIQEFLRSPSLEVLVGTASLDWRLFEVVVGTLKSTSILWSPTTTTTTTTITTLVNQFMHTLPVRLTLRRTHHSHSTLSDLVAEFYDSQCAERRDKIYGILGIADDCDDTRGPQPDYSKHIVEVYFGVYRYLCARLAEATTPPSAYQKVLFAQTISLTIRALNITQADVENYLFTTSLKSSSTTNDDDNKSTTADTTLESLVFNLRPDYVNTVDEVLPGWTSIRDLRQRLDQVPWEKYVGHEVVRRKTSPHPSSTSNNPSTSTPRTFTPTSTPTPTTPTSSNSGSTTSHTATSSARGTEYVRAPLPPDLLTNVIAAATATYSTTHDTDDLANLHNYETCGTSRTTTKPTCRIPHETILSHEQDKRLVDNPGLTKPSVIIESNHRNRGDDGVGGGTSDPLIRLGFACTNVRKGDLICQFRGVDVAIMARRVSTGGRLSLVGLARMVGHSGLGERGVHSGCKTTAHQHASQPRSRPQSTTGKDKATGKAQNEDKNKASWWWSGMVLPTTAGDDNDEKNDVSRSSNTNEKNIPQNTHHHHDYTIETDPLSLWELFRPRYE